MRKLSFIVIMLSAFLFTNLISIKAEDYCYINSDGKEICQENQPPQECQAGDTSCTYEMKVTDTGSFFTSAILSFNPKIAEKEKQEPFAKYLEVTKQTATKNDFMLLGGREITIMAFGMLQNLVEGLLFILSFLILVLYNLTSGDFLIGLITNTLANLNESIFHWRDAGGAGVALAILIGLIVFVSRILESVSSASPKKLRLFATFFSVIIATASLIFVNAFGIQVMSSTKTQIETAVASALLGEGSVSIDTANKNAIYEILQEQPFILRNFGVSTAEDIKVREGNSFNIKSGQEALEFLMNDVSENWKHMDEITGKGNNLVIDTGSGAFTSFLFSLILIFYRVPVALTLGMLIMIKLIFGAVFAFLLGFVIINVAKFFLTREFKILEWVKNKLFFIVIIALMNVGLMMMILFLIQSVTMAIKIHTAVLIIYSFMVCFLTVKVWQHQDKILSFIKTAASSMVNPEYSPKDLFGDIQKVSGNIGEFVSDKVNFKSDNTTIDGDMKSKESKDKSKEELELENAQDKQLIPKNDEELADSEDRDYEVFMDGKKVSDEQLDNISNEDSLDNGTGENSANGTNDVDLEDVFHGDNLQDENRLNNIHIKQQVQDSAVSSSNLDDKAYNNGDGSLSEKQNAQEIPKVISLEELEALLQSQEQVTTTENTDLRDQGDDHETH